MVSKMKSDLIEIIEDAGEVKPRGDRFTMLDMFADCIEQYEENIELLPQSSFLLSYVRKCVHNNVAKKGSNTVGYKQLIEFVELWSRKVKFK
ncbi:TPA: hypothetical protein NKP42_004367 [Vibrio parahaemolyticus]|nr:hypothetical protein [Vibrio parahaemolyticus]EKO3369798.1 hypothetical protein [Vibrio fluvialis]ELW1731961.1 hypothetical protein [Vibrio fluvialis]MBE3902019.1 hypothetical protein [Vibrio parahaemolyticus]HCH0949760.1 hypothetical protein [Vibrio parahaemolyticus]